MAQRSPHRRRVLWLVLLGLALLGVAVVVYREEVVAALRLAVDFESLGRNEQGFREYRHRQSGLRMVLLPGGAFTMGSADDDVDARPNEHPEHDVVLDAFLIAKYEISKAEWIRLSDATSRAASSVDSPPATKATWFECTQTLSSVGLRLPTEAEWEYAARSGTTTAYCFGDAMPPRAIPPAAAENVRTGAPNAFGLHHVHGNVAEWCADGYEFAAYESSDATRRNPLIRGGATEGKERRVVRGGSFSDDDVDQRSAFRAYYNADHGHERIGYRPVLSYYRERTPVEP